MGRAAAHHREAAILDGHSSSNIGAICFYHKTPCFNHNSCYIAIDHEPTTFNDNTAVLHYHARVDDSQTASNCCAVFRNVQSAIIDLHATLLYRQTASSYVYTPLLDIEALIYHL